MKPIKRNSLHFRLYEKYANGDVWDLREGEVNFCKYSRTVGKGALWAIVLTFGLAFLLLGPLQIIGTLGLWLFTDNPLMPFIGHAFPLVDAPVQGGWLNVINGISWLAILIELLVLVGGMLALAADKYNEYRDHHQSRKPQEPKERGFISTWYRSWKDKYCPIVTLENSNDS